MKREFIRVVEDSTLVKDSQSGAVLRTDLEAFQARKAKKIETQRMRHADERIAALENRVAILETALKELIRKVE